jgi:two-component system cell cycle response regulator
VAKILIIDDSNAARIALRSVLEDSDVFEVILEARDGLEGLKQLLAEPVDAVICDLEMPGLDGEKLLAAQRARTSGEDVPFLFLTAHRDPDRIARLLRAGASDWIQKPFHPSELLARLELQMRLRRLQSELRDKNASLERLSTIDPVTGLRTRRWVNEFLAFEVLRSTRYHTPLALLMADLDHFKQVNDSHGHRAGDAVLRDVAGTVQKTLRSTDVVGRWGGEEFLVVLPQTDLDGAVALAERVRQAVEYASSEAEGAGPVSITLSIGVAALGGALATADALVEAADGALYEAKGAGRNRVAAASNAAGLDRFAGRRTPGRGGRRA